MVLALHDSESRLNAVDALNLLALFLLAVVVAFFRRQLGEEAFWLLGVFATLMVFVLVAAFLSSRWTIWRAVHDFSPVLLIPVIFNTLGPIIDCASPGRWDATFAQVDMQLFGTLAATWRSVLGRPPWLIDLASVAYAGYYVAPVALAIAVYWREPTAGDFRCMVFTVVLTFYVSYVGYFMFPTLGPRVPADAEARLVGGSISQGIRQFIEFAERTRTDAFPSGHTAVALVCLQFAWRASRPACAVFVPLVGGIVFSTVYLHYHYVIDVVAGVAMAWGCAWLGPRLQPVMEPRDMMRWVAVHLGIR